jgi:hypothetical protein
VIDGTANSFKASGSESGFELRLGRLIPADDVDAPDPPGCPPIELLELLDSPGENVLGIIESWELDESCDPISEDIRVELDDELDAEAVADGLNGESDDELADPDPVAVVLPEAFGEDATFWLPGGKELAVPGGGGPEAPV